MRKILASLALVLSLGWRLDAGAVDDQTVAKCVVNPTTAADGETMPLPCNDSGQLVTSSTSGGGSGGTVDQGTAAAAASAWPVQLVIGGAVNAVGNAIFVKPGTGASWAVTGTFWQATQPVSATALPLPSGAATAANQSSILTALGSPFQAGGSIANTAFQANAGTNLNTSALALETGGNLAQLVTDAGAPGATACATDTASCNFNQQLQRIAQRLTTLNTTLGSPLQASGTVQPGNTANTTPWLVTPKGVQDSGGTDMTDTTLHALKAAQIVNTGNAASLAHICGLSVTVNPSTATDTLAVEISGSTDIYICDISASSNGTNNFFLESAASTSCASTKTQLGNTWYTQQYWARIAANPYYRGVHTGAGKGLCVNTSAANALSVTIHYDQY